MISTKISDFYYFFKDLW